ncbi:MAG: MFS transporter [Firmicutes bacterium]|nr:MFS transporter [Bacillota bacterium]
MLISGGRISYTVFVLPLMEYFDWSRAQVSLPFSISMLMWGLGQPVAGILMDRYGARALILVGIVQTGLGFLISAAASELWHLNFGYGVLVGLAATSAGQIGYALIVAKWFDGPRRGFAMGICMAATPLSTLITAPLFYWVIISSGWRVAFQGLAIAILVVAFPLAWLVLHDPHSSRAAAPAPKSLAWAAGTAGTLGVEESAGTTAAAVDATSAAGGSLGAETLALIRNRSLQLLALAYVSCGISGFFFAAHLAPMAGDFGLSPAVGAAAVSIFSAASVAGSFLGGAASDRYGRSRVLSMTFLIRAIGFLGLAFAVFNTPTYYLAAILAGGPIFATVTIINTMVYEIAGPRRTGLAIGLILLIHQLGATVGPYAGGLLYDITGSYLPMLLAAAAFLLGSSLLVRRIGDTAVVGTRKESCRTPQPSAQP